MDGWSATTSPWSAPVRPGRPPRWPPAAPGPTVVLIDRADFPRDKACGDGIAPHALDVLADLGVTGAVDGFAPVPALRLVSPGGEVVGRPLARPAYTVPRKIFDARLVAAALRRRRRLAPPDRALIASRRRPRDHRRRRSPRGW